MAPATRTPTQAPTPEEVAADLEHVLGLLTRLDAAHPGHTVEDLIAALSAARSNPLTLAMLTASLAPRR